MDLLLLYDLAAFEELADACRGLDLTLMCTDLMNLREERLDTAVVCLEGHRADLVGPIRKSFSLDKRPYCMRTHELSTVKKCETLLRLKADRLPSEFCPYVGRRTHFALVHDFSHTDERKAEVGERSEVAGGTERALLVHYRQHVIVEHVDKTLHCHQLDS